MPVAADSAALRAAIRDHFQPDPPACLGVAVSGGSDSLALLALLAAWADETGAPALHVVTVDHGLRPESGDEAAYVGQISAQMGLPHTILKWEGWDGHGNLADRARRARYDLMAQWAGAQGIHDIALGHTRDDQAETLLMRLARQAGLDGLAGMSARHRRGDLILHRPLLAHSREALRAHLRAGGIRWVEDPSNSDATYRRVQARRALNALRDVGITAEGLAQVAHHLAEARATLAQYAVEEARKITRFHSGDLVLERPALRALSPDITRRILQAGLKWVSGAEYGARGRAVDQAIAALHSGTNTTLQGCRITLRRDTLRISREPAAVVHLTAPPDQVWDGRWRLAGPGGSDGIIRALGAAGRAACPDWRVTGLPATSIEASPALWHGDTLVAAPVAGLGNGWSAVLCRDEGDFYNTLLSH